MLGKGLFYIDVEVSKSKGGGGAWGFSAAERGNESSKNKWNEFAITTTRKPTPSPFRDKGKKSLQKRRRRPQTHPELENEIKKNFLKRNASKKLKLPFHRDRRGMNFVNRFLASYWSWLVQASFFVFFVESSLSGPDPFLDRLLNHLLILSCMCFRGPHSFNHLLVIAAIPRKGRGEESSAPIQFMWRTEHC